MARKTSTQRYISTFFDEKGIDLEESFEITTQDGTWNLMSYGVIIKAILGTGEAERAAVANRIRRIDFQAGDVKHYLRHLAQGLAETQ